MLRSFTSEDDVDLKFLGRVIEKVNTIAKTWAPSAFQHRFGDLEVAAGLEAGIAQHRSRAVIPRRADDDSGIEATRCLEALKQDIALSPQTPRTTIEVAFGIGVGRPRLEGLDSAGRMKLIQPRCCRPYACGSLQI